MKVYSCPKEVPAPEPDYSNYDHVKESAKETLHQEALKKWLIGQGYTGKHTGEIVSFGVADGSALYMLADGRSSCLIHLPYGDAYQYPDVRFLPKSEILRRMKAEKAMVEFFKGAK